MAFSRKAYCSLDDVHAALGTTSTADDDALAGYISQAQAWIDERLGFGFQTDGTSTAPALRTYNGTGKPQLLIDRCLSLSTVLIRTWSIMTNPTGTYTRTSTDVDVSQDVVLGPANRLPGFILERYSPDLVFDLGKRNILVNGIFGYDTIPGDITRACIRLAIHYLMEAQSGYQDKAGGTGEYGVKTFRTSIPDEVCQLVDQHRRRTVRM